MNNTDYLKNKKGFTLVEVMVYMMLLGIVMTSIYSVFITNMKSHKSQENTMQMVQDLRGSVDVMVREIRMAGFGRKTTDGKGFSHYTDDNYNTDSNSIHFTMDLNGDGDIDDSNEDINYFLYTTDGITKIGRRTANAGSQQPLAEEVSALTFKYYNSAGTELTNTALSDDTDREAIHSVEIEITARTGEIDPITKQNKTRTLSTRVRVRNAGL